jgi:hypothetical protein
METVIGMLLFFVAGWQSATPDYAAVIHKLEADK